MNTNRLIKLRRPATFLAVNALALLAGYLIVVDPIVGVVQERHEQIEQKAQAFVRMASLIERKQVIEAVADESEDLSKRPFLQGETPTMLSADLLAKLRQLADRYQVSFNSVASLPQRKWLGQTLVSARVEFVAPSLKTSELLTEIESGLPFLFIHSAKLSAPSRSEGGEETVAVALEIYGATQWRDN